MIGWSAWVGLGSNLGNREAYLRTAVQHLEIDELIRVERCSPVYESEAHLFAIDSPAQPEFLNAVVQIKTQMSPLSLLDVLLSIETSTGRRRASTRWAARELDLDLLLFEDLSVSTERLILPHPAIALRRFVLQPLSDLVPELVIPEPVSMTVADALVGCSDLSKLVKSDVALC